MRVRVFCERAGQTYIVFSCCPDAPRTMCTRHRVHQPGWAHADNVRTGHVRGLIATTLRVAATPNVYATLAPLMHLRVLHRTYRYITAPNIGYGKYLSWSLNKLRGKANFNVAGYES